MDSTKKVKQVEISKILLTNICVSVDMGRDEVLQAYTYDFELVGKNITCFCFVLLKLNFKLPEIETLLPIHLIKKFPLREKHATKGGQRLQVGEEQEEKQRQRQHLLLLLPRRSTDRMCRRCLLLWWRLLLWWQRLWW